MMTQRKDDEKSLFQKVWLSEIVSKFDGEGDVAAWIEQVRIAKRIMQLADADLADLASLALKGKAFAVYQEMPPGKRADFEEIAEALMTAFAEDKLLAHAAASERKYVEGEGVDAYLNELKRLGRIAKASEDTIQCWFILGLPTEVAEQLRATPKVHSLPQETVLEMARAMVHLVESKKKVSAALVAAKEVEKEVVAVAQTRTKKGCFECGQNHFVRNCPKVKNGIGQRTGKRYGTGGQRGGHLPVGTGGQGYGQWVFQPFPPAGGEFPAIKDHAPGNEFGLSSAQPSARY